MFVIGLTGGIASGKSTVSSMLRELGATIIDADLVAKELQNPHTPVWREIVNSFGSEVVREDDSINRELLGQIVFNNPSELAKLNNIVHPKVIEKVANTIEKLASTGKVNVMVIDAALLLEAKMERLANEIWVVNIPAILQIERLMARNGFTRDEALARLNSQMPLRDKLRYADRVIDNSGTVEDTRKIVNHIWQEITHKIAQRDNRRADDVS